MSAKDMFEELGYNYFDNGLFIIYEQDYKECVVHYKLVFSKENKCVEIIPTCNGMIHYFSRIEITLLKAINKQIEELGWESE